MDRRSWLAALTLAEFSALVIALVMPVTPSKTGSDRSLAELFIEEPSYLEEVFVYFVGTNALMAILGAAFWVSIRRKGGRDEITDQEEP